MILLAEKRDMRRHAEFPRQALGGNTLGAIAGHQQMDRNFSPHAGEYPHTIEDPLHRAEIRNMKQPRLSLAWRGGRFVDAAIDEITNYADRV